VFTFAGYGKARTGQGGPTAERRRAGTERQRGQVRTGPRRQHGDGARRTSTTGHACGAGGGGASGRERGEGWCWTQAQRPGCTAGRCHGKMVQRVQRRRECSGAESAEPCSAGQRRLLACCWLACLRAACMHGPGLLLLGGLVSSSSSSSSWFGAAWFSGVAQSPLEPVAAPSPMGSCQCAHAHHIHPPHVCFEVRTRICICTMHTHKAADRGLRRHYAWPQITDGDMTKGALHTRRRAKRTGHGWQWAAGVGAIARPASSVLSVLLCLQHASS
jgi:hypothetical protein